jgi:hypothetical protein
MNSSSEDAIAELDGHGFDEFSHVGELEGLIALDPGSADVASLQMLSSVTVGLKFSSSQRPFRSLHVYVALGLPPKGHNGVVDSKTLDDFYQHFFATSVSTTDLHNLFSENVTIMVVRRLYYNPTSCRAELVGALTFSRPRDRLPTYLAYMAVSDGHTLGTSRDPIGPPSGHIPNSVIYVEIYIS